MQDTLTVSDQGLRLIKAFEGYRPVDRKLVSGTRVVGYGHEVRGEDAVQLNEDAAHEVLLDDLAPFEDMLNENVYASVSQAQFDALASLAYNIGPKAFLDSDVLGAVNAGRPLEAASAFDAWRLADIGGRTFVVDALVRRRTAEKALFLRPGIDALAPKAPRTDLQVEADARIVVDDGELDVLDRDSAGQLVADAPYEVERLITDMPSRRRDDVQVGDLAWSEVEAGDAILELDEESRVESKLNAEFDPDLDIPSSRSPLTPSETPSETRAETPLENKGRSVIAEAADDVRDRLAALMDVDPELDTVSAESGSDIEDDIKQAWPESLIQPAQTETDDANVVAFPTDSVTVGQPDSLLDIDDVPTLELTESVRDADVVETVKSRLDSPDWISDGQVRRQTSSVAPYIVLMIIGGTLLGAGAMVLWRDLDRVLGMPGDLAGLGAALLGALILTGGLGYLVKQMAGQTRNGDWT